jgi:hypothetical protein
MVLSPTDLIQAVRERGGRFLLDGDRLGVSPRTAGEPFAQQIRERKREIADALKAEIVEVFRVGELLAVPLGVRIVSWNPKTAPVRLSVCSTVTDVDKFIRTTLAQLAVRLSGKGWLDGGWGLSGLLARLEACGCVLALDDPQKAVQ